MLPRSFASSSAALARSTSGLAAAEFAMLLPVFLGLVLGLIQVGQIFWTQTALQHAVEMAARCASVNTTTCGTAGQIQTYAITQAYGMTLPAATFTASTPACGNQVTASHAVAGLTNLVPLPTITLTARSCYPR
jgi:Flp pilus assembly protein TadG